MKILRDSVSKPISCKIQQSYAYFKNTFQESCKVAGFRQLENHYLHEHERGISKFLQLHSNLSESFNSMNFR